MGLVHHTIQTKFRRAYTDPRGDRYRELAALGYEGLLDAALRFDASKARFSTYARYWIWNRIWRWLQLDRCQVHVPLHRWGKQTRTPYEIPLDQPIRVKGNGGGELSGETHSMIRRHVTVDPDQVRAVMAREVRAVVNRVLSGNVHAAIVLRFGLNGGLPMTLEEVGRSIGLSRERARQLEADGLSQLREALGVEDWQ